MLAWRSSKSTAGPRYRAFAERTRRGGGGAQGDLEADRTERQRRIIDDLLKGHGGHAGDALAAEDAEVLAGGGVGHLLPRDDVLHARLLQHADVGHEDVFRLANDEIRHCG
jgi:hypothetical protein